MIQARPYIEPASGKVADYKRISESNMAIVSVHFQAKRYFIKRRWINAFGGGVTHFLMMPIADTSFARSGNFIIAVSDWTNLVKQSLNQSTCVARVNIHEWRYEYGGSMLYYHDAPVVLMGDKVTLLYPVSPLAADHLTVVVESDKGHRFVLYYEQLQCQQDEPIITPNGA